MRIITSFRIAMLCCMAVVAVACSTLDDGGVTASFGDVVQQHQNLVFTFDDNMAPDSMLNRWDTTRLVKITPYTPGKVKWLSGNQLVFSPSVGFDAATQYKVELLDAVASYSQGAVLPERRTFAFSTPSLTLGNTSAYWSKNASTGAVEVRLVLAFNYQVNPLHVGERLHLTSNGSDISFSIDNTTVGRNVVVNLTSPVLVESNATSVNIKIDKGLRCEESSSVTTEDISASAVIPDRRSLQVVDVTTRWDGMEGVIEVAFNQAIDPASIAQQVTLNRRDSGFSAAVIGNVIEVRGSFTSDNGYYLAINTGVRGVIGGAMSSVFTSNVNFDQMESGIAFASERAMYLSSRGSRAIGVRIINVPKVRVTVFKVYENNILHFLRSGRYNPYWGEDESPITSQFNFNYIGLSDYADTVMTREVETSDLGIVSNGVASFQFDVKDHISQRGLYLLKFESTEDQYLQATKLISMSDVGLIAKQGTDNLTVFANSIADATPLPGVELKLYSTNNQVIGELTTDGDGMASLQDLRTHFKQFSLGMVTATYGGDYTVMVMQDTRVDESRFELTGRKNNAAGMQAFIYGDRDLYRPSETIHLNTIVRDNAWAPISGAPVKLRVIQPNGRELRSMRIQPNEQGAATADVALSSAALTGIYRIEAYSATDVLIGNYSVAVEEFMPDKVKVNLTASKEILYPGQPVDISISGMSFFGTPAAKRNFEVTMRTIRRPFTSRKFKGYSFSIYSTNKDRRNEATVEEGDVDETSTERRLPDNVRVGTLDDNGNASVTFMIDSSLAFNGLVDADFYVTVFDESGRPVHRSISRPVHTQPVLFGIRTDNSYMSVGQEYVTPVVACGYDGNPVSAMARVQVVRSEWYTALVSDGGSARYRSQRRDVVMQDKTVQLNGTSSTVSYRPSISGEYEIRVSPVNSPNYVRCELWAWRYGNTAATSFEVNTEGTVDIELDKDQYNPGDKAKVLFKTPFAGKLIVTIERSGVLQHHIVQTDQRSASLTIPVENEWAPNVFISATLIKPHIASEMPLTVAHGYAPLVVQRKGAKLPVTISTMESSRSSTKQTVTVRTEPGAHVTIAVVDEGILQIRNTSTPNPYDYFYAMRALEVSSYDMYPFLFPELKLARYSYGAGDDRLRSRINPILGRRVNLVSMWSGILEAKNGTVTFPIEIPEYTGSLRVMVVAWKNDAFGSGEKNITVADPLVLSTALPRVLSPGDSVFVPVMITNTTQKNAAVQCVLNVQGPASVIGEQSRALTILPGTEVVAGFTIKAGNALGEVRFTAEAKGLGETFKQTTYVAVRPAVPLTESSGVFTIKAGESAEVPMNAGYVPGTTRGRLIVSNFPAVQISRNLGQLLGYPYGCIEQTISKGFPQIYFADLANAWHTNSAVTSDPAKNVQEAVRKVQSMQMHTGGVSYWPQGTSETWWGSAYAAHFLLEAKRAGYEVDNRVLDNMVAYLARKVKQRSYNDVMRVRSGDGYVTMSVPSREIFYSLFVLAISGKQDVATMNVYKQEPSKMAPDSRYMLACTYLLLGDRKSYTTLTAIPFNEIKYEPFTDNSFASPIRDMGIALYAMAVANPDDAETGKLAMRLSQLMKSDDIYSTQENVWAVLALGKLARRMSSATSTATIWHGGKQVGEMKGNTVSIATDAGGNYTIKAKGGQVYAFWSMEGVKYDGSFKQEDVVIKARRTFLDRYGKPLNMNSIRQNDIIVIKISLSTTDNSYVGNVVVSDLLPSGFELENPRLGAAEQASWAKDEAIAEYYDYRDDRMIFFTGVSRSVRHYYYAVRVVSKGKFKLPPLGADAMYNDDVHSYSGGGVVVVM